MGSSAAAKISIRVELSDDGLLFFFFFFVARGSKGEEGPGNITLTLECLVHLETWLREACLHLKKEAWGGGSSQKLHSLGKVKNPAPVTGRVRRSAQVFPEVIGGLGESRC